MSDSASNPLDVRDENGWTPREMAVEKAREEALIAKGRCPWSGETIVWCKAVDLCDCFLPEPESSS